MQHRHTTFIFAGAAALGLLVAGASPALANTNTADAAGGAASAGFTGTTASGPLARGEDGDRRRPAPDESCPA